MTLSSSSRGVVRWPVLWAGASVQAVGRGSWTTAVGDERVQHRVGAGWASPQSYSGVPVPDQSHPGVLCGQT